MNIKINIFRTNSEEWSVKAYASIVFDDKFKVTGISIRENNRGNLFVSMPSYRSSEATSNYNVGDTNVGDTAYIIESNRLIRETVIIKKKGNFYTVKFKDTNGAITLKAHRLYGTRDEAEKNLLKETNNTTTRLVKGTRPPHRI
ncbi:septation protein SpoVG family protein [Eubacterium sp.]|uniref:septation protein SpoVG family protein n=1 Tax=Eubacterium sp. TaxID=142586 RepID=UPI00399FB088